jgi:hypothetical protein
MGLRAALKQRMRTVFERLSGEYSAAAPDEIQPFERNLGEDPSRKIVRAQLHRPKPKPGESDEESS